MRAGFLILLGTAGCNWVFGIGDTGLTRALDAAPAPDGDPRIDLDRDGVKDVEDPCIAPDVDLLVDTDGDGVANNADACPLDRSVATLDTDVDQDGIADPCDPTSLPGDRLRCIMAFTDPDFDSVMWLEREPGMAWLFFYPRTLTSVTTGSIVADWSFESKSITTYEVTGTIFFETTSIGVLARAAREPSTLDAGCRIVTGQTWSLVTSDGSSVSIGSNRNASSWRFWMQLTLVPGAADGRTLRCRARIDAGATASVDASMQIPQGTLAFEASTRGVIDGLVIYERDDAPP